MRRGAVVFVVAAALAFGATPARAQEAVVPLPAPAAAPPPAVVAPPPAAVLAPAPVVAPTPARVPLARRWWFWAGLGGAAVAVVVAGILLTPEDPYRGNADAGVVTVF
jgi:hypothetical protein